MSGAALAFLVVLALAAGLVAFSCAAARWAERKVPPQGRVVNLGGERLHVLDVGAGTPLVLIHGLSGQIGNFSHSLVRRLAADFRVVAIDRPGSGYSPRAPGTAAGPQAQAASLARAIHALGLGRPVVVGHSLGGAVALALALDHPDCVGALALIAPATQPMKRPPLIFEGLAIRSPLMRRILFWTVATPAALLARRWGAGRVFAPEPPPPDFDVAGGALLALRPANMRAASEDMVASSDDLDRMVGRYPRIRIPVGVLCGRDDAILDWRVHGARMKEAIPTLDLELVAGGHMLPVTAPNVTAAFIRRIASRALNARPAAQTR